MKKSRLLGALCACLLCVSLNVVAAPILYDFNFGTGPHGLVTGQFIADLDSQAVTGINSYGQATATSFTFNFQGVTFDAGTLGVRRAQYYADFTGVWGTIYSSSTVGASLWLNTCFYISCIATWENIPGVADGSVNIEPQLAVSVAAVPLPATLWLFGSGLLGLIEIARRKKAP